MGLEMALGEVVEGHPSGGCVLRIYVQPGARRDAVVGLHDGALKVAIQAPPVEGKANARCLRFFAKDVLGVSPRSLSLVQGERGRKKRLRVAGLSEAEVVDRLRAKLVFE